MFNINTKAESLAEILSYLYSLLLSLADWLPELRKLLDAAGF